MCLTQMLCMLCRDCKDKIREVAGEALLRMVKFLGPMYAVQGESLRTKAAATLTNLATDNNVNAKAIAQLGESDAVVECCDAQEGILTRRSFASFLII